MPASASASLREWLWLTQAPGVGDAPVRRLLAAFGDAQGVSAAGPGGWQQVVGAELAGALGAARGDIWEERCLATQHWLHADPARRHVLGLTDSSYPAALRQIPDPPPLLFAQGDLVWLEGPSVAIVGSRRATAQGLDLAREFAAGLSAAGLTVVSGMALGIDGAAHEGALAGAGKTIAVVGTGLDMVYPPRHKPLAQRISEQGLLLSELPPGTPALPVHFPRRNRIIAGLSLGTLVVEAAARSGSLITARLCSEYGREVLAIPGSIRSQQSVGCHQLIREGAQLVTSVQEVLGSLLPQVAAEMKSSGQSAVAAGEAGHGRGGGRKVGRAVGRAASQAAGSNADLFSLDKPGPDLLPAVPLTPTAPSAPAASHPLLVALGADPMTLDQLADRTGWPADRLQIELLTLELDGRVARLPGGLFQQRGRC